MKKLIVSLLLLTLMLAFSQPALADIFYVNDADTLIAAINAANATPEMDVISLAFPITLTAVDNTDYGTTGLPVITTRIVIFGNSMSIERDAGAPDFRIFHVAPTGELILNELTISNGHGTSPGGGIYNEGILSPNGCIIRDNQTSATGGGVFNALNATLHMSGTWITENTAQTAGGIGNAGRLRLFGTIVSDNESDEEGGGIKTVGDTLIVASDIARNTSHLNDGGGIIVHGQNNTIINTRIVENTAPAGIGGGIYNIGRLDVIDSVVDRNTAPDGGGIANLGIGILSVINSTISGNDGSSGGIGNLGEVNILNSTIAGNTGGGIGNGGLMTIKNSTILDSIGPSFGGGIYNNLTGTMMITNSTISGNASGHEGGGIENEHSLTLHNTTIVYNAADYGGGIYNYSAPFNVQETILAGNIAGIDDPNCGGSPITGSNNLSDTPDPDCIGFGSITPGTDFSPLLADNSGPTQTHALIDTGANPAIDPGVGGTLTDQRGVPIQGSSRDIGAYEYGADPTLPTVSFMGTNATYDETAGTISIELNISGAANFAGEATVYIADVTVGFVGFATPGLDYVYEPVTAITVDCSVEDCAGGVTRSITLTILQDNISPETNEIVRFEFVATNGFATVGTLAAYTVTIQDVPPPVTPTPPPVTTNVADTNDSQSTPEPELSVFDPAVSKIGFLLPGQLGVTGEQIEWVITVSNPGTVPGANVVVTDTLRPELRVDHATTDKGNVSINGQTVTFTLGTLNPGESVQMSIFTTVIRGGLQVDNTAIVSADNMANSKTVTAQVVTSLPNTGESPLSQWRWWLMPIIALLAGMVYISRH